MHRWLFVFKLWRRGRSLSEAIAAMRYIRMVAADLQRIPMRVMHINEDGEWVERPQAKEYGAAFRKLCDRGA